METELRNIQQLVDDEKIRFEQSPLDASPAIRNLTSDFYFPHLIDSQTQIKNAMEDNSRNNTIKI